MYAIGQKLQCTKERWINGNGITNFNPPKKGETVTVKDIVHHEGHPLLNFEEQVEAVYYPAKHFSPQQKLELKA